MDRINVAVGKQGGVELRGLCRVAIEPEVMPDMYIFLLKASGVGGLAARFILPLRGQTKAMRDARTSKGAYPNRH